MKALRIIRAVVLAMFLFGVSSVSADSQVDKAFKLLKAQSDRGGGYLLDMVMGAEVALDWANSSLITKGQDPLYCIPHELSLNSYNYADIALKEYERLPVRYRHPVLEDYPNEVVVDALAYGLKATFPCKSQSE